MYFINPITQEKIKADGVIFEFGLGDIQQYAAELAGHPTFEPEISISDRSIYIQASEDWPEEVYSNYVEAGFDFDNPLENTVLVLEHIFGNGTQFQEFYYNDDSGYFEVSIPTEKVVTENINNKGYKYIVTVREENVDITRIYTEKVVDDQYDSDKWTDIETGEFVLYEFGDISSSEEALDRASSIFDIPKDILKVQKVVEDVVEMNDYLVVVQEDFVRDTQIATVPEDDPMQDEGWHDTTGEHVLGVFTAQNEDAAIQQAAKISGVSGEILGAYLLKSRGLLGVD